MQIKIQTRLMFLKTPHLVYKIGEDPVSDAREVSALLGGQLHPRSLTSYNTQLPSAIGSPIFSVSGSCCLGLL